MTEPTSLSAAAPEGDVEYIPFSLDDVSEWLLTQPYSPGTHALLAAIEALEAEDLFSWGPHPGSKAEGEYERAHAAYYAIEQVLHDDMVADGFEA